MSGEPRRPSWRNAEGNRQTAGDICFVRRSETLDHSQKSLAATRFGRGLRTRRSKRIGELLLQNAINRTFAARHTLGIDAVLAEARDAAAEAFYRMYGSRRCDKHTRRLYHPRTQLSGTNPCIRREPYTPSTPTMFALLASCLSALRDW